MARKQPKPIHQLTVAQFERMFPDEDACCAYLVGRRWPDGVRCPRCGAQNPHKLPNRPWSWQCYECAPDTSYRFSHIAGTIFENTNKPLRDWYRVVHLMLTSKKGMSALQIKRYMGFGSYETAWSMCHKVRVALMEDIDKLGGIVEVDETFVGGLAKNRHWDKRGGGAEPAVSVPAKLRSSALSAAREMWLRAWSRISILTLSLRSSAKPSPIKSVCFVPINGVATSVSTANIRMALLITPKGNMSSEQFTLKPSRAFGLSSSKA
jgi:hypothetical protein